MKAALGIFLDCKRARPELAEALQLQADMALRQACQDEDLKWVSLLMWLGANPRAKGLATDDLDTPDALDDPEYQQSALQIACRSKEPKILKRLKPDPATDDLRELMAAAASLITTPETVAYLVTLGADVNDKSDGGSTVLETCLRNFAWREAVWEASYPIGTASFLRLASKNRSMHWDSCWRRVRGGHQMIGQSPILGGRCIASTAKGLLPWSNCCVRTTPATTTS